MKKFGGGGKRVWSDGRGMDGEERKGRRSRANRCEDCKRKKKKKQIRVHERGKKKKDDGKISA